MIAHLLLDATPGESYLASVDRSRLGQTCKTLHDHFRTKDRKVYYLRTLSCTSTRCVCFSKWRNYCGMTKAAREVTFRELRKEYLMGRDCMPDGFYNGEWNCGCICWNTKIETEHCGRTWKCLREEDEYNERMNVEHYQDWFDSR